MAADLLVFDSDRIQDRATFTDPLQYSEGVDVVIVNGEIVLEDGEMSGATPGNVLRHAR